MTNALNLSIIEGRLVKVPQLRRTGNGTALTTLFIAVNGVSKTKDTTHSNTTFLSCVVWGKSAEYCVKYLVKGQAVRIKGKLHQSTWIDKVGLRHSKLEVTASNVEFLAKPKKYDSESQNQVSVSENSETIPF